MVRTIIIKTYGLLLLLCLTTIVQAVVNNFVPLLFVTFQSEFDIPLSKITLLITFNFLIQLFVDLVSAEFVDKIGYKASMVIAHFMCASGLVALTFLPDLFNDSFVGILIAVMIYAVGGGLLEVIVSPVVEACPTDNKEKAMSLLHSFYCWGQMGVVLISTLFFAVFSIENDEIEEEIVLVYSAKTEINNSEILFELKKHLASYMIPSKIIYKKSLPLVPSDKNKINKEELKKEFIAK